METQLSRVFDDVRCESCRQALAVCPPNEFGMEQAEAEAVYLVGNIGRVEMGHQMYHTRTGRTAICVAKRAV